MHPTSLSELNAALLQAVITLGIAALCAFLFVQFRKRYFLWWAVAWGLYVLRIGAICGFLTTAKEPWLYVHQVLTGWTALALLGAALTFSQQLDWRRYYLALVLFPPLWSYVAIYKLENFFLAAVPAVLFLSMATVWTGWAFWRYQRRVESRAARFIAGVLLLWGLHHLDYPLLRARGAWNPWGYYLDIGFVLALGAGILLLVLENGVRYTFRVRARDAVGVVGGSRARGRIGWRRTARRHRLAPRAPTRARWGSRQRAVPDEYRVRHAVEREREWQRW